jgi:hypothetical protein
MTPLLTSPTPPILSNPHLPRSSSSHLTLSGRVENVFDRFDLNEDNTLAAAELRKALTFCAFARGFYHPAVLTYLHER